MTDASMLDPRWRRLARLRWYCNASCIAAIVAGSLILCGWIFRAELLAAAFLDDGPIDAATALCFVFAGLSLWLLLPDPPRRPRRYCGLFFASLLTCLGAMKLAEQIFGLQLADAARLARWFLTRETGSFAAHPVAHLAPVMSVTFFVLGIALLSLEAETRLGRRPAQWLSLWGALVAVMCLSGHINGATAVFGVFSYTPANVFAAFVVFAVSGAIFFARPRLGLAADLTGRYLGSAMARRFLPAVLIVPLLAAWLRLRLQHAGWFGTELGLAFNVMVNVVTLSLFLWLNARKLNESAQFLEEAREAKDIFFDASLKDDLTGLYNRRGFLTFAEEQIRLACAGRRELLVVFADLDGLKAINDQYGHSEGDCALKKAAEVLLAVFRDTDLVARLGGDEFAVLALDCSPAGMVRINAHFDKLLRAVNKTAGRWKLSISVGAIHVNSENQLSIDELLGRADKMMYERKRSRASANAAVAVS